MTPQLRAQVLVQEREQGAQSADDGGEHCDPVADLGRGHVLDGGTLALLVVVGFDSVVLVGSALVVSVGSALAVAVGVVVRVVTVVSAVAATAPVDMTAAAVAAARRPLRNCI